MRRMMMTLSGVALAAAAASLVVSSPHATELRLPDFQSVELSNGLKLYAAEDHTVPIVAFIVGLPYGGECDPPGKSGLASLTAKGCCNGVPGMDGTQVWLEMQRLGGGCETWSALDRTFFFVSSLSGTWEDVLTLVARGIRTPTFPKRDVARLRTAMVSDSKQERNRPGTLAARHAFNLLYDGRLGSPPSVESARSISRDDLVRFHRTYYQPKDAIVVAIGDFKPDRAIEVLRAAFEDWPQGETPPEPPASRLRVKGPHVRLVHKPGLTQATIRCSQPGLRRVDPDHPAWGIANVALGGHFCSRLMTSLRSQGGKTYDAGSWNDCQMRQGQIHISTFTRNDQVGAAIDTIRNVLGAFARTGITQEEMETARSYILGSYYMINLETLQQIRNGAAETLLNGRTLDEYRRDPAAFEAVTLEQTNRMATVHLRPEEMVWVVVGDKGKIGPALRRLGDYETVDYREPLNPGNLITRTRFGTGLTWNTTLRGGRLSLLYRQIDLFGSYGISPGYEPWERDGVAQAGIDWHRSSSEYSSGSLYLGATGTVARPANGFSPHAGLRLFPNALGGHCSLSIEAGPNFWDRSGLYGLHAGLGVDWFF